MSIKEIEESDQIESNEIHLVSSHDGIKEVIPETAETIESDSISVPIDSIKENEQAIVVPEIDKSLQPYKPTNADELKIINDNPGFYDNDKNRGIILGYKKSEIYTVIINYDKKRHLSQDNKRDYIVYDVYKIEELDYKVVANDVSIVNRLDDATEKLLRGTLTLLDQFDAFVAKIDIIPIVTETMANKKVKTEYSLKFNVHTNTSIAKNYPFPTLSYLAAQIYKGLKEYFDKYELISEKLVTYEFFPILGKGLETSYMDPKKQNKEISRLIQASKIKRAKQDKVFKIALKNIEELAKNKIEMTKAAEKEN